MTEHEHAFLDLVSGFVLGTLSTSEEQQLLDHLAAGCAECEKALARLEGTRLGLAVSTPGREPPVEMKRRVLDAARLQTQERADDPFAPRARVVPLRTRMPWYAWAVAAVLVVAVGALSVTSLQLRQRSDDLNRRVATLESTLDAERDAHRADLASRDEYLDLLLDPRAVCVDFDLTPNAPGDLRGKATYDPTTRRAVIALDNATLPTSQDYELWAIRDGRPFSLGVIPQTGDGTASAYVSDVGALAGLGAFAVSLEPAGGSPQPTPTGPVVLLASLGG